MTCIAMIGLVIVGNFYTGEINFDESMISIDRTDTLVKIRYQGLDITDQVGTPELPVRSVMIALPAGAVVKDVVIRSLDSRELPGTYRVMFSQPPVILSADRAAEAVPDAKIYFSDDLFPARVVDVVGSGTCEGQLMLELMIHPVQCRPRSGKLIFNSMVRFEVKYEGGAAMPARGMMAKSLAYNGASIPGYELNRDRGDYQYVIITNPPLDTVFQRMADWKTKKGVPACVRTKDWIVSTYPGEDNAARIRNYIKTLPDSSVEYVLLGGDTAFIPCRFAYAMTCSAGYAPGREDTLPCDLYYADTQGDWDLDNDGSYGEIEDNIDLYPDVYLGRAPVNTVAQAQRFIDKVLAYERSPAPGYLDKALFTAEILWTDPYTDQGVHKNKIGEASFTPDFQLTKLYQSLGNETKESVMAAIREGQGLFNHDGHGWIDLISVGGWPNRIYSADFDTITNDPYNGILYSIGCWTAAFDFACVAEAYVNSPTGGGVAYIGNSSYGWGSPGNPGFGYSDRFDSRFFYTLFNEDHWHLGQALSLAKAHYIPFSREKNVYRWHQYEINLLGDPELPVWTNAPESMVVLHPQAIPLGPSTILITVRNAGNGLPVAGALACLMKGSESYSYGLTDAQGQVQILATPASAGSFDLTVTAHNYLCEEHAVPVASGGYVNFQGWALNDMFGNNDSIANPGEDVLLSARIKNCGTAPVQSIEMRLRDNDPLTIIPDSTAQVDSLAPGDSLFLENAFGIQIGTAPDGHAVGCDVQIVAGSDTLDFSPVIMIGVPVLSIDRVDIPGAPTLPGEPESLYVNVRNAGHGYGHATWAQLFSSDPYVTVPVDGSWYGDVEPESARTATQPFVIAVSPACPASYCARLPVVFHSENYQFIDTLSLLIGNTGFADDMESGSGQWTTGGSNDLWHISGRKAFSPTHAWYCGSETLGTYMDDMDCYIQSVPFMVRPNSLLKFYRWFSVPLYGSDGIYVVIIDNRAGTFDTLDFIGTGGALGLTGIQSDWFEEKYSLADYPAGETVQVRIAFVSDADGSIGEGFYIDDVNIEYITGVDEKGGLSSRAGSPGFSVYPNPFNRNLTVKFQIPNSKFCLMSHLRHGTQTNSNIQISLKIFDAAGRLIRDLSKSVNYQLACNIITWRGEDDQCRRVPAGVYFIAFESGDYKQLKKVVLLK
jgi:hypothetical protein